MSAAPGSLAALAERVLAAPHRSRRRLVAVAGAPGSGKSTLAMQLAQALSAQGSPSQVVPMDGFHLDNRILEPMGLLARKGAPETFDATGLGRLLAALGTEKQVYFPIFDRPRDLAVAGAGVLEQTCDTVIVEGNYLLLDAPHWRDMQSFWDIRISLQVADTVLRARLIDRWLAAGLSREDAIARAEGNDMKNAQMISAHALPCDVAFVNEGSLV